jgi:glycosyltransferase involved in cell wall biosynthesis
MKILLDLQGCQTESRFRGIGRQVLATARAIADAPRDHEIHVLLNRRLDDGLVDLATEFGQRLSPGHVHMFEVPGGVAERDSNTLWRTHAAELVREAKVAEIAPDIVHVGSLFEGYVDDAVTSIGRFKAPFATAVTLHDLIPLADPERYLSDQGARRHWLRKAQFLKRADVLLSVSEYSAAEAFRRLHIPTSRIQVMSAGVDPAFKPLAKGSPQRLHASRRLGLDQPFVLYVGAVDPRKNVELIFAAFALLARDLQSSHLLAFAGRLFDEEIGHLRVLAARYGVASDRLRFLQQVSEEDLVDLYATCAAFVFPSLSEGFGLPALEAMASGAPTLAARSSSLIEVVGHPELLFDPTDAQSLAGPLGEILSGGPLRRKAMTFGLNRARAFTWSGVADRALDAMESAVKRRKDAPQTPQRFEKKPTLAFVSPLPSDASGVADYSAALLRELAVHYEIECVVGVDTIVEDEWILANFVVRDTGYFARNSHRFDRILYNVGNSHFHAEMLGLLSRYPGVVLLHDFFLSDLIDWMASAPGGQAEDYYRELYRTHGLTGLLQERRDGRLAAVRDLPTNALIFESALGVIMHSQHSVDLTRKYFGDKAADAVALIPHLKSVSHNSFDPSRRGAARRQLGLAADAPLLVSFGVVTNRKQNAKLVDAWDLSVASKRAGARLAFVGGGGDDAESLELRGRIEGRLDVSITGYVSADLYDVYLAAADLAVQLRIDSRGETSGAILDCLSAGVPVIVNAHGAAAELSDGSTTLLGESFSVADLRDAIDGLFDGPAKAADQVRAGHARLVSFHRPSDVGQRFFGAIERFVDSDKARNARLLIDQLADFTAPVAPDRDDLIRLSTTLAAGRPRAGLRQILYDITVLNENDAKTGIQRVARSILINLIDNPPAGYRIEPIFMDGPVFRYARRFVTENLNLPLWVLPEAPVEFDQGDVYLSIDWVPDRLPKVEAWLRDFRRFGGKVVIGVHDLLPLQLPEHFPDFMPTVTRLWFESALRVANQFVCVSRTVADDVARFGQSLVDGPERRSIAVDYFHNAADLTGSVPSRGRPENAAEVLSKLDHRDVFLMVGTIEPRKGHVQALSAFEQLWRDHENVALVIVGKQGWMMDDFTERMKSHPEYGNRLIWLDGISDEFLDEIYAAADVLVAASAGEGFGLPLVEAALQGCSLIARDIPVFREVAGDHALYFSGFGAADLARCISEWRGLNKRGRAPSSGGMSIRTWAQTTQELIQCLESSAPYRTIVYPSEGNNLPTFEASSASLP